MWAVHFAWLACLLGARALSEYDYLMAAKEFADSYLAPRNAEIAQSINSTLLAEDVVGSADLSTNFDGRELATEYLFGLFVNLETDEPSPIGVPRSYNLTSTLVQGNTVIAGMKFEFYYPALQRSFPIEIEAKFNFNELRQVTEYDLSFRRWAWANEEIIPLLIPYMAQKLNTSTASPPNDTQVLHQYLAQQVCQVATDSCNGTNLQYDSYDDCMTFLGGKQVGEMYRLGDDNLSCRWLHTKMLKLRPNVHCPHVGPSGGDMCIPRNYSQVVLDSHFPQGFFAPESITPENRKQIEGLKANNDSQLDDLIEISMEGTVSHSWDPSLFATCTFGFLLILYGCSHGLFFLFNRFNRVFPLLRQELQKNVVMYTLNVIFTTIALILQLAATPVMAGSFRLWEVQVLRAGAAMICALYCFELIYRFDMRLPLIAHHILTIVAISVAISVLEYTQSLTYLISAIIWGFQATVEQSTFIGLIGYRLKWSSRLVSYTLIFAAWQALVVKVASAIALIVYWGVKQSHSYRAVDRGWSAVVWTIATGLLLTQFWGSWITYKIGVRVAQQGNCNSLNSLSETRRNSTLPFNYNTLVAPVPESEKTKTSTGNANPYAHRVEALGSQEVLNGNIPTSSTIGSQSSGTTFPVLPDLAVRSELHLPPWTSGRSFGVTSRSASDLSTSSGHTSQGI